MRNMSIYSFICWRTYENTKEDKFMSNIYQIPFTLYNIENLYVSIYVISNNFESNSLKKVEMKKKTIRQMSNNTKKTWKKIEGKT